MKLTTSLALLATVGSAAAGGVTGQIAPSSPAPAGCSGSYDGEFEITVVNVKTAKRDYAIQPRESCGGDGNLVLTLSGGVLTDSKSRTGYIASNFQFQFDDPPQAGAIYTAGYSVCTNGSLALGGSAVWYECSSGSFYNLYDRSWAAQCSPVELAVIQCGGNAAQAPDGQVVGTAVVTTTIVSAIADGQPQVITTELPVPLCQISDGQAQVHTTPCASVSAVVSSAAPVSQYSDGQIQVTPATGGGAPAPATTPTAPAPAPTTTAGPGGSGPGGSASVSSSGSAGTTLATTASTTLSSASSSTASAASTTSSTVVSGAGHVQMGSVSALFVGLVGAIFVL